MNKVLLLLAFALAGRAAAVAQVAPEPQPPEIARLEYFLGRWQVDTVTPPSVDATRSVQEYERLPGTSFVVLRSTKALPAEVQLAVFGFDPVKRVYSADYFTAPNLRVTMAGIASGEVWTWISRDGQLRQTIRTESPTAFSFQVARSRGTTGWTTISEGKAVRIDEAHPAPAP